MKSLIQIAAEAAEELEGEYYGNPEEEFLSWLQIALEREAMVSEAYDAAFVDDQLDAWKRAHRLGEEVVSAVRRALMGVWAQETAHQSYFKAVLEEVAPPEKLGDRLRVRLGNVLGRLQGRLLGGAMSHNKSQRYSAQIAIVIGSVVSEVPEYVQTLREKEFSEFCTVNGDLEHTAVLGYDRMVTLTRSMPESRLVKETPVLVDLKRTGKDERYHEALFRALAGWPPPPPGGPSPRQSPLGPAPVPPITVSLEDAHAVIARAKKLAYGADAEVLGDTPMEINRRRIAQDPFVIYLRKFAAKAADEGETTKYMTAGA